MQLLWVNRRARLVLCPEPSLHLLTPHFPGDLGACPALPAFCRVKVIPAIKADVTLRYRRIALGTHRTTRSCSICTKRDHGRAIGRTEFWLEVVLGSPRSACQEHISPETAAPSSLSPVLMQIGMEEGFHQLQTGKDSSKTMEFCRKKVQHHCHCE